MLEPSSCGGPQMRIEQSSEAEANMWWSLGFQLTELTVPLCPSSTASCSPVTLCHTNTCSSTSCSDLRPWLTCQLALTANQRSFRLTQQSASRHHPNDRVWCSGSGLPYIAAKAAARQMAHNHKHPPAWAWPYSLDHTACLKVLVTWLKEATDHKAMAVRQEL